MSKVLSRADIIGADDLKTVRIAVPEWGGDVFVRVMTGMERDEFEDFLIKGKARGARAELAARTLVDEQGQRLFTGDEIEVLGKKSAPALDRVFDAAQRLNGFSERDIKELEKN